VHGTRITTARSCGDGPPVHDRAFMKGWECHKCWTENDKTFTDCAWCGEDRPAKKQDPMTVEVPDDRVQDAGDTRRRVRG